MVDGQGCSHRGGRVRSRLGRTFEKSAPKTGKIRKNGKKKGKLGRKWEACRELAPADGKGWLLPCLYIGHRNIKTSNKEYPCVNQFNLSCLLINCLRCGLGKCTKFNINGDLVFPHYLQNKLYNVVVLRLISPTSITISRHVM